MYVNIYLSIIYVLYTKINYIYIYKVIHSYTYKNKAVISNTIKFQPARNREDLRSTSRPALHCSVMLL